MRGVSCAAIDMGASNGRVVVVDLRDGRLQLREARRFHTPQRFDPASGHQCWDLDGIESEIRAGLFAAGAMAPLSSVGADFWAVDYVLLDGERRLVAPAVCYRDERTRGMMEAVFTRIPPEEIYRRTGIQFQPFNTLYQLAATARQHPDWLARTRRLLMLPDYIHYRLGGAMAIEHTNATTTQLVGLESRDWDDDLLAAAGISRAILSRPVEPGTRLGETEATWGERRLKIVAPGTHDTASAVACLAPGAADEAYISSGTWSLMGVLSERPLAGEGARRANFTNEGAVGGGYRVLKNIAGLWLLQRLGQETGLDAEALVAAAEGAAPWRSLVDPDEGRFLSPRSMVAAIRGFCAETGQPEPADPGALSRCALDSLALSYRKVKGELEMLLGKPISRVHIGGGGGQNRLLDQLAADACGVPVLIGPAEITVLGNACVQLIALGAIASLGEARALVRDSFADEEYRRRRGVPDAVWDRFQTFASRRPLPSEATS
jgi:rhamnulokinase